MTSHATRSWLHSLVSNVLGLRGSCARALRLVGDAGVKGVAPTGGSVRPGLHNPGVGAHAVAWWDPAVLALNVEEQMGIRQQRILEADEAGGFSAEMLSNRVPVSPIIPITVKSNRSADRMAHGLGSENETARTRCGHCLVRLRGSICSIARRPEERRRITDNVLTYGMGYHLNRYSPLKQIDRNTVKRLVPVWNLSLDNNWGEQAQPIVYNGMMYVTNARATVAIDVATGKQIWKQTLDWPPETPRVVCCGVSNKGAAIYNGKVFRATLDAHVVAYDAKTGKEIWKSKAAEWKEGFSITMAPLLANGVLMHPACPVLSSVSAVSSTAGIQKPATSSGGATPSRRAAKRATRPGRKTTIPGRLVAAPPGSPVPTIPELT